MLEQYMMWPDVCLSVRPSVHVFLTKISHALILSTKAHFYTYDRLCVESADKILTFAVLKRCLLQQRETEASFVFIIVGLLT